MPDEIRARLAHIEEIAEDRPGDALEELQAAIAALPEVQLPRANWGEQ